MSAKSDLELQVEAYDSLLRHPGWKLLQEEFRKRANASLVGMENAKDDSELVKHTHMYLNTCKLLKMPEMLRDTLGNKLQVLIEKL